MIKDRFIRQDGTPLDYEPEWAGYRPPGNVAYNAGSGFAGSGLVTARFSVSAPPAVSHMAGSHQLLGLRDDGSLPGEIYLGKPPSKPSCAHCGRRRKDDGGSCEGCASREVI